VQDVFTMPLTGPVPEGKPFFVLTAERFIRCRVPDLLRVTPRNVSSVKPSWSQANRPSDGFISLLSGRKIASRSSAALIHVRAPIRPYIRTDIAAYGADHAPAPAATFLPKRLKNRERHTWIVAREVVSLSDRVRARKRQSDEANRGNGKSYLCFHNEHPSAPHDTPKG